MAAADGRVRKKAAVRCRVMYSRANGGYRAGWRYRLQFFVQAQNLTNERNYLGYSGTLTSPFFGQPTAVNGMRKIDVGIALSF